MKCHYVYDKELGRILIPYCYGSMHMDDMSNCTCGRKYPLTFSQFEKKEYNERVKELLDQIKELEKYSNYLNRIIRKLLGWNKKNKNEVGRQTALKVENNTPKFKKLSPAQRRKNKTISIIQQKQ